MDKIWTGNNFDNSALDLVMAAVDLLRVGQARERDFAMQYLEEQLA